MSITEAGPAREPPEIKWRACSWDAIDDQREGGDPP
jgi:hypothetical protein